jgi:hypothetical protein
LFVPLTLLGLVNMRAADELRKHRPEGAHWLYGVPRYLRIATRFYFNSEPSGKW